MALEPEPELDELLVTLSGNQTTLEIFTQSGWEDCNIEIPIFFYWCSYIIGVMFEEYFAAEVVIAINSRL